MCVNSRVVTIRRVTTVKDAVWDFLDTLSMEAHVKSVNVMDRELSVITGKRCSE